VYTLVLDGLKVNASHCLQQVTAYNQRADDMEYKFQLLAEKIQDFVNIIQETTDSVDEAREEQVNAIKTRLADTKGRIAWLASSFAHVVWLTLLIATLRIDERVSVATRGGSLN
jgi:hypothetical protein